MRNARQRLLLAAVLAPLVLVAAAVFTLQAAAQRSDVNTVYLPAIARGSALHGRADQEPRITVQPTEYNFGFVRVGQVATTTLRIANTGSADLSVTQAVISPTQGSPFTVFVPTDPDTGFPVVLRPQTSINAIVACRPTQAARANGAVVLSSNDPISPTVRVALACRGQQSIRDEKDDKPAQRFAWFDNLRIYPGTGIPPLARLTAWQQVERMRNITPGPGKADALGTLWRSIGPSNISGRVSSVVVDPNDTSTIYAGGAGGGLWVSTDEGLTWEPRFEQEPSLSIGSIAVTTDPVGGGTVLYAGTGEANGSTSLAGVGVLFSTNNGDTWTLADTTTFVDVNGALAMAIYKIQVAPTNPRTLYVATNRGLFTSTNPAAGWTRLNLDATVAVENVSDVSLVAGQTGHLYAAIRGMGVYSTTNPLVAWTRVFTPPAGDRISLGTAPSNARRVYASVQNAGGADNLEVYTSADAGTMWNPTGFPTGQSPFHWYTSCLGVDPADDTDVYVCDLDLWRRVGGGAWTNITNAYLGGPSDWVNNRPHPDHHAVAFGPLSGGQRVLYIGNDGGLYRSPDRGATWAYRSDGLTLMEFTDIGITVGDPNLVGGGAQDQGTNATNAPPIWQNIRDSDGGYFVADPVDPNIRYSESQNLGIAKTTTGGEPWTGATAGIGAADPRPWVGVIVMDPNNRDVLYTGTDRVYRTTNAAGNWTPMPMGHNVCLATNVVGTTANPVTLNILGTSTGAAALGFAVGSTSNSGGPARVCNTVDDPHALANGQTLVVSTQVGAAAPVQEIITFATGQFGNIAQATAAEVTAAINGAAANFTAGQSTAGSLITAVAVAPSDSNTVYAGTSQGELWRTTNAGATWTDVTSRTGGGAPQPNRAVSRLAVDPANPQRVYKVYNGFDVNSNLAGHVFRSSDGGATWPDDITPRDPGNTRIDIPFQGMAIDASNPSILYTSADIGVFRSVNSGASWEVIVDGLPYAFITDLELTPDGRRLRAASHARGVWELGAAGPSVSVSKVMRPVVGPVTPGALLTFDMIVANTGSTPLASIPADDFFDHRYLQFVSASVTPNAVLPGRLEWDNLAGPPSNGFGTQLQPSAVFTMTATFRVTTCPSDQFTLNKLEVTAAQDADGAVAPRASATAQAQLVCGAATLTKTRVGPERVAQGETVRFDITIQNTGNVPITTLPLTDSFDPAALTFDSALPAPNSTAPTGTLTWNNLGPLAPGASLTVRVNFIASGCPPGQTTTDTARVSGAIATAPSGTINLPTMTASASVDIACPDLRIEKTLVPPPAGAITLDQIATFNIRITNEGNKTIRYLPLEDLWDPTHLAFESATPAPNAVGYGHAQWTDLTTTGPNGFGADLTPGSSVIIVLRLRAIGCPPLQDSVDKARILGAIDEENNPVPKVEATATVKIACPRLAIEKKVTAPPCGIFGVGDPVPFTVTITNTGNSLLTVIPLEDTYDPMFLGFVSATPSPDVTAPPGTLRWNDLTGPPPNGFGVDLAPGATFTVNLTFTALQSTSSQVGGVTVDTVTIAGATDQYGFVAPTVSDSEEVTIRDADLYIEKVQKNEYAEVQVGEAVADTLGMAPFGPKRNNRVVYPGEIITYTVKYGNKGPDEAAFVKIQDVIPPGTIYLGHNLAPCVDGDIRVGCFVGRVAPGEKREFEVYVRVPRVTEAGFSTPPGTILRDTITIGSGFTEAGPVCGTPDSVPANNTATYDTTVLADYGDAPAAAVGTLLPGYGAGVTATYSGNPQHEWLGRAVSGERSASDVLDIDAEPNLNPFNTDHHDDGVFFRNPFAVGLPTSQRTYIPAERAVTARVTITVADPNSGRYGPAPSQRLYAQAWADSNKNGIFGEPADQLLFEWNGGPGMVGSDGVLWQPGELSRFMDLRVRVPGEIGWFMARVRLSYGTPPVMSGPMDYGEIEDYLIGVFPDGPPPQPPPGPVQPRPPAP